MCFSGEIINRNPYQCQYGAKHRIDQGFGTIGIIADICITGHTKKSESEQYKNCWYYRIAPDFIRPLRIPEFGPQNKNSQSAHAIKEPAHKDEHVGEHIEGAAEYQHGAPDRIEEQCVSWCPVSGLDP